MTRRGFLIATLFSRHRGMVRLAGGTFRMGSDESSLAQQFPKAGSGLEAMLLTETPAFEATIAPFWMDRHEVTNDEFGKFVRTRPAWRKHALAGTTCSTGAGISFPKGKPSSR
jgi:formylglycine-generating enzyme required for sulfatase activity